MAFKLKKQSKIQLILHRFNLLSNNLCLPDFFPVYRSEFMENLCNPLYDTLRPLIIKIQHLETLAELCTILRIEMLEEQAVTNREFILFFISTIINCTVNDPVQCRI